MSDILTALASNATGNKQTSQLDQLVNAYVQTQQPKLNAIQTQQTNLENKQKFYTQLNTKVSTLVSQIDRFQINSTINDDFGAKTVNSSDATVVTATGDTNALEGINSIKVNRLASNDSLISARVTSADSFGLSGTQTLSFTVNGITKNYDVTFDGTETNEQAIKKFTNKINSDTDRNVNASIVKDSTNTLRFVITSKDTGSDNAISIADSASFAKFGLNTSDLGTGGSRKLMAGTAGGYKNSDSAKLDAEAEVNGILVTRGSNTMEEVVPGLKITLLKPQLTTDAAITLTTATDTDSVAALIQPLLDAYNGLSSFTNSNSTIRRSDTSINSLSSRLRSITSQEITSATNESDPHFLSVIGITVDTTGQLKISDKDKLKTFLEDDPKKVANLFTSSDGIIAKLQSTISNLTGDTGIIRTRGTSLVQQIESTKTRLTNAQAQVDKQAATVRKQYTATLQAYYNAQGQYQSFSALGNSSGLA